MVGLVRLVLRIITRHITMERTKIKKKWKRIRKIQLIDDSENLVHRDRRIKKMVAK